MEHAGAPLVIVSDYTFAPEDQRRIEAALDGALFVVVEGRDALRAALVAHPETEIVCSFAPPADVFSLAPAVRWIALPSAGADRALRDGLVRPGGPIVTTANGIHAIPIGEFVMSLMLMWVRHWPQLLERQRDASWPDHASWLALEGRELADATLGIIGLGAIGRQIAQFGRGFGMRIVATRRTAGANQSDPDAETLVPPDRLADLLAAADFVVVSVPATPQTHHLIGASELRMMRRDALLINISRGSALDEAALVAALTDGVIGGAGLDVFAMEPLPADSPLWRLPNVMIAPHLAGNTDQYSRRFTDLFLDNLTSFRAGEPLRNVVDLARGY